MLRFPCATALRRASLTNSSPYVSYRCKISSLSIGDSGLPYSCSKSVMQVPAPGSMFKPGISFSPPEFSSLIGHEYDSGSGYDFDSEYEYEYEYECIHNDVYTNYILYIINKLCKINYIII